MITKSGLELIAQVLKDTQPDPQEWELGSQDFWNEAYLQWRIMVCQFSNILAQDNPRFKADKFFKACDYDEHTPQVQP